MAENKPEEKALTAADVAKLVKRELPILDKETGKPTGKTRQIPISANEVLSFRDYGDHVVVVTNDGQKFRGDK